MSDTNWEVDLGLGASAPLGKRKILVVTSWNPAGHVLYGKTWEETAKKFWPANMVPYVVTDEDLEKDPEFVDFMKRHADKRMDASAPGYDYRFDLVRFAHKIFALKMALDVLEKGPDWIFWLDGDVLTKARVTDDFLDSILPNDHDGVLLSRAQTAANPECGFMAFNMNGKGKDFLRSYIKLYLTDTVLKFQEQHDSHVFMAAVIAHMEAAGSKWLDLAPTGTGEAGLDAFEASPLHSFFTHRKGARKYTESPPLPNSEIIAKLLGDRTGIVVAPDNFKEAPAKEGYVYIVDCQDHPIERIRALVDKVDAQTGIPVIFLGYYSSDADGQHVDDTRYGINAVRTGLVVFESVIAATKGFVHVAVPRDFPGIPPDLPVFRHRVLTPVDKTAVNKLTNGAYKTNFLLQTQNCASNEEIHANIRENLGLIKEWVGHVRPHRGRCIIVSGGPSLKTPETLEAIRAEIADGAIVICVKHSHRYLVENGIIPYACVLLDPREHDGYSTHGVARRDLIPGAVPGVRYFIASMVHPSVTRRILDTGGKVFGWHAAVGANETEILPKEVHNMLVPGGSSSAGRAMILFWQFLGYMSIGLYAFDSCHLDRAALDLNARHQDGTPKYVSMEMTVGGNTKVFMTDRDILSQAQDFTRILKECPWIQWDAHGPGMVSWLYQNTKGILPKIEERYS